MPPLAARQPPPADYYAANLRTVIERVLDAHGDLLRERERGYFESLIAASVGAQRLYARLLSRSRPWVRIDKLKYREIENLPAAIAELSEAGLISVCARLPADALLGLFTQVERKRLFPDLPVAPKARWIELCVSRYPDALILRSSWRVFSLDRYLGLRRHQPRAAAVLRIGTAGHVYVRPAGSRPAAIRRLFTGSESADVRQPGNPGSLSVLPTAASSRPSDRRGADAGCLAVRCAVAAGRQSFRTASPGPGTAASRSELRTGRGHRRSAGLLCTRPFATGP